MKNFKPVTFNQHINNLNEYYSFINDIESNGFNIKYGTYDRIPYKFPCTIEYELSYRIFDNIFGLAKNWNGPADPKDCIIKFSY